MNEEKVIEVETVEIGGTIYNSDQVTPSLYFDYVKGMKSEIDYEDYGLIIDNTLKMLEKAKITEQTAMAKKLNHQLELAIRELNAAKKGFNIFVNRKDIELYISKVEGKAVKIIELSRYTREIPDDVIEKIAAAKEVFDELYIMFTDYTKKETKKVAKERRDKDPILFGAFIDKDAENEKKIYVEDRMFFIADWVEEKCDLTLEEICRDIKSKEYRDITYKVDLPTTEEAAKAYLDSFNKPVEESGIKTVSLLFDKIKALPKKTTTRKKSSTSSKNKEEGTEAPKRKRGRPRKNPKED